jgi:hypothetical protein
VKKREGKHDLMVVLIDNKENKIAGRIHAMRWEKCEVGDVGP